MVRNRHNLLRSTGAYVAKTTLLAAVAVSAWIGGYKLAEGLDQPGQTTAVEAQGFTEESVAKAVDSIEAVTSNTFLDLTVGVGAAGLAGLLVLGGTARRLSMAEEPGYEYTPTVGAFDRPNMYFSPQPVGPGLAPASPGMAPISPTDFGFFDQPPLVRVA